MFLPMVADHATMEETIRLGLAVETAHPSAVLVPVFNERTERFRFVRAPPRIKP